MVQELVLRGRVGDGDRLAAHELGPEKAHALFGADVAEPHHAVVVAVNAVVLYSGSTKYRTTT